MPDDTTAQQAAAASQSGDAATTTQTAERQAAASAAATSAAMTATAAAATAAAAAKAPAWPENWRETVAGDDAKKLARLQRYTDPNAAFEAMIEAQNKIRAGEFARPLAADATDAQKAEWRAANGIPDKVEAYFDKLPDGLVIGQDDLPLMTDLIGKNLLKHNVPPAVAHDIAKGYYEWQEKAAEARRVQDKTEAAATAAALHEEWGHDFKANQAHVLTHLDGLGAEKKAALMDATLPNGTRLFNDPDTVKWFASTARELNPIGIIAPSGAESQAASVDAEINSLKTLMGKSSSEYWKGPNAEKNQARYRQLLEWQSAAQKRGRAA